MIIECCSQERSYQRFYGLLGERFCHLEEKWVENFDAAFQEQVRENNIYLFIYLFILFYFYLFIISSMQLFID